MKRNQRPGLRRLLPLGMRKRGFEEINLGRGTGEHRIVERIFVLGSLGNPLN